MTTTTNDTTTNDTTTNDTTTNDTKVCSNCGCELPNTTDDYCTDCAINWWLASQQETTTSMQSAAADIEILHAMQLCEKHNACPPLVGVKEFAAILGLRYQYVQSRLKRLKEGYVDVRKGTLSSIPFPAPVAELACGPVWLRAQAVAYKEAREEGKNE